MSLDNYPKISIVTANYNLGKYLEKAITSILSQGYPNLEYIIIDGGSTDNSIEIIKKYEDKLAFWISEPDKGMYDAINKGFQRSTGEIMAWLNSDDMYHTNSLFTVAEIFNTFKEVKWLMGNPNAIDKMDRVLHVDKLKNWSKYQFYKRNYQWIQQESTVWRRELWEKAGGGMKSTLKYAGDFELWLRFFKQEKLYVTPALIGSFRVRKDEQLSSKNFQKYLDEVANEYKELEITEEEKKVLKEINFIEHRLFRIPFLKKSDSLNDKLKRLYDFPKVVYVNPDFFGFNLF